MKVGMVHGTMFHPVLAPRGLGAVALEQERLDFPRDISDSFSSALSAVVAPVGSAEAFSPGA